MARPRDPNKQQVATLQDVMAALAADDVKQLKDKKVTRGVVEKAATLAKSFNQRFKLSDAFVKFYDSLPAAGAGLGRSPAQVGEDRVYKLSKKRALVISLAAYGWAQAGGQVRVHYGKDGPIVTKG